MKKKHFKLANLFIYDLTGFDLVSFVWIGQSRQSSSWRSIVEKQNKYSVFRLQLAIHVYY